MATWTFDTPGQVRLDLELPAGRVELETTESDKTHVELEALRPDAQELVDNARIDATPRGGGHEVRVAVQARYGFFSGISLGRGPHIRLAVSCPPGADVSLRSKSADVMARGRYGSFDLKTASGDANIDEVTGDARVKTASGDVTLDDVHGETHVQSASGDVAIQHARGDVVVQAVSGDLWIREADASVHANTVSGDQRLEAVVSGTVESRAVSGDVLIGVRRGSSVYVDANTVSGSTNSELELSDAPSTSAEPDAGDEGPMLELSVKTVSGDVSIVRAAARAPQIPS